MASLKSQLKSKGGSYELTMFEHNFLKDLNTALATSIYHKRLMSGLLTYISKTRLGLEPKTGYSLTFEVDLSGEDRSLKVTETKATED